LIVQVLIASRDASNATGPGHLRPHHPTPPSSRSQEALAACCERALSAGSRTAPFCREYVLSRSVERPELQRAAVRFTRPPPHVATEEAFIIQRKKVFDMKKAIIGAAIVCGSIAAVAAVAQPNWQGNP